MLNLVQEIKSTFADHDDFFIQEEQFDQTAIFLMGFNTLIDFTNSNLYIRQMAKMSTSVKLVLTRMRMVLNEFKVAYIDVPFLLSEKLIGNKHIRNIVTD